MKSFDYIFYRVSDYYKKKRDSSAEITGALIVSLLQLFSILDIFIFVRVFWEFLIPDNFTKYWALPLIILLALMNWNKYVKQKKYREYRKKWKDEPVIKRRNNGWKLVMYLLILMLIPVLYGFIRHNLI